MYKKNIRLLSLFNFLIGFSFFAPLAIIYFSRISGSFMLGASIFGIVMLSSSILEIPTGIWSDRVGRKYTIIFGSASRFLAFVCYALGYSYWWLVCGAILEGMSRAFYSGNNDALLYDSLADEAQQSKYEEYQGKVNSTEQLSMGISALVGGLIANYSFNYVMWLSVFAQLLVLIISFYFIEPHSRTVKSVNIYVHLRESIELFIKNKKLRLLSLASILSYSISELKWEFTSAFVAGVWPLWAIGISRTLPSFGASLSFYFSGKIIRRFSAVKILLIDNIFGKIVSLVAYSVPSVFSPLILAIPSTLYGVGSVAESTLMQKEFTDHQRATMSSLNSLGGSLGFAIMSLVLGGLADSFGASKALIILTLVSLPIIFIYWQIFKNDRRIEI